MRIFLATLVSLLPGMVVAEQSPPSLSGCFIRTYSPDHLASHPDQLVTQISISPSLLPDQPPLTGINVFVAFRGNDYYYSSAAYCEPATNRWSCGMEGDAGSFTLSQEKPGTLRLSVGKYGMSFEGQDDFVTIHSDQGDDREFLIPLVDSALCN